MTSPSGVFPIQALHVDNVPSPFDSRTYLLEVSANYAPDVAHPLPVIFAFHGSDGGLNGPYGEFNLREALGPLVDAAGPEAIFVYPDALLMSYLPPDANWNTSWGVSGWDLRRTGWDIAFFDALLRQVSAQYCIDTERVFAVGFSNGAYFTDAVACYRGDVIRAGGAFSGGLPPDLPMSQTGLCRGNAGMWFTSNTDDRVVPYAGTAWDTENAVNFFGAHNGCDLTRSTPLPSNIVPSPCRAYLCSNQPLALCNTTHAGYPTDYTGEHAPPPADVQRMVWDLFSGLQPRTVGTFFHTLTPCRVADTRLPDGPLGGPALAPNGQRVLAVAGTCGVPAAARSISANVTVTGPGASGFVSVFPADQPAPLTSTLHFGGGQTRASSAILLLSSDASPAVIVRNASGAPAHVIVDVNGYFK